MSEPEPSVSNSTADGKENPYLPGRVPADGSISGAKASVVDRDGLPALYGDRSFWGMVFTQFLGAFNDNLFKQLMLLLALVVAAVDLQGIATVIFALPFILFSGFAGYLSDKYSKRPIIILSKVAEILVMLLGLAAFIAYGATGYIGLLVVMFLMGTQSAFFGPGKYGILPEMLRPSDLPRANGMILMTTFFAIILGTASAGFLKDLLVAADKPISSVAGNLRWASVACVVIAVMGTLTSLAIRRVPPANRNLEFRFSSLTVPPETRRMLRNDFPLLMALGASCMFWLVAGVVIQIVNAFGKQQLVGADGEVGLSDTWTSVLTATTSLGIAIGAVIAGRISRGKVDFRIVRVGAWGLVAGLLLIAMPGPGLDRHLLGFWGSLPTLVMLGMFSGMFAIPVQVFLQARPPTEQKGRMIAVMNQANFTAILLSGVVYFAFVGIVNGAGWSRSPMFGFTALIMLPVALFYRPRNEALD